MSGTGAPGASEPDPEECARYVSLWRDGELKVVETLKSPAGPLPRCLARQRQEIPIGDSPKGGQSALAKRLVDKLDQFDMQSLNKLGAGGVVTFSTICSGSDLAVSCNAALSRACSENR